MTETTGTPQRAAVQGIVVPNRMLVGLIALGLWIGRRVRPATNDTA